MKKEYRLLKNKDFQKVLKAKHYVSNQSFSVCYRENDLNHIRIGISVSKKLGGAVKRNLIKRQVRMMASTIFQRESNLDVILLIRQGYLDRDYAKNKYELDYLYQKIKKR